MCQIEKEIKKLLRGHEGLYDLITSCEIESRKNPDDNIYRRVDNSYFKGRSGHLTIVTLPNWYLTREASRRSSVATHGSPWSYDTYVPIIFYGPGIPSISSGKAVGPHDIASTIADYLQIKPPPGSFGKVLLKEN